MPLRWEEILSHLIQVESLVLVKAMPHSYAIIMNRKGERGHPCQRPLEYLSKLDGSQLIKEFNGCNEKTFCNPTYPAMVKI